ncbi:MAG: TonB-dependent receptor [Tannerella sp.]|jgi:TonB-linked SusC/RagA family outer membrane protein|nr:TonB-dependent receptor [Tannerella sp.]
MKQLIIGITLLLCAVMQVSAQRNLTVQGTVYDETGETMPGVAVYIKDRPGIGTTTDENGVFSIKASKNEAVVFSYIGYKKVEHYVQKEEAGLEIRLEVSASELEEVVVEALGIKQRKISTVGAVSTIDARDLQVPATALTNMLGGRMAGVITMQTSGEPGKNISEFWIRGIGTFGANASALVLIDGLEGDINSVDPADIESFSVLKDASATAVYGVRGANGVVLINTKRGEEGKLKISFRSNLSLSKLQRLPDYVGSYDYASLVNEALISRGDQPKYSAGDLDIIRYGLDRDLFPDVDWQKEIIQPLSLQQTYYVNAQGGGSVAKYFLSLGMSEESAAYKVSPDSQYGAKTGYNTYTYRTNLDIKLTESTHVFFSTDGYLTRRTQPGMTNTELLWFSLSSMTPIVVPLVYSTGHLPTYGTGEDNISPYIMMNYLGTASESTNTFKNTINVDQDLSVLLDGLNLRVQGAFDTKTYFNERRYVMPDMYYASSRGIDGELQLARRVNSINAMYSYAQRQYRKYHLESTLNYNRLFNEMHRFSFLAYYYMSDSKDTNDISGGGIGPSMKAIPKRYQGLSSRLTYGYLDTYLLDVNFGYTGSENFQSGHRFGFFPSVALGWVPTQYEFVKDRLPWITFFKIRGSYGTVGNDRISDTRFPYLTIVNSNASTGWGYRESGISENSIGADNLVWEKAVKANIGIDAHFFDEKLNLTVDAFNDRRNGIFQERANIPGYAGLVQMPYGNVGRMKSYGSDGNISYTHELNRDSHFTLRANYTYSANVVENWEQATPKYDYQQYSGYPHDAIRGYISMGLFRDEQDVESSPAQTFSSEVLPGDIKYKDVNGDGVINADDRVVLSYPTYPRLMYGFGGEYQWKNLTLGILFKGTGDCDFYYVGQEVSQFGMNYINGMGYVPFHAGEMGSVQTIVADPANRWISREYAEKMGMDMSLAENPDARFPRLTFGRNENNSQISDFWKGNKKYLRLQEVSLNYNLKADRLRGIGVSSIDFQLVGNNLYIWDSVGIYDPEQAQFNGRAYPIPLRGTFQVYIHF